MVEERRKEREKTVRQTREIFKKLRETLLINNTRKIGTSY